MPLLEICHGHVGRKARPIGVAHGAREAKKNQAMRAQERRNLRDRKLLLRTRPVSATYPYIFTREMACPLICKLMGKRDDGYGFVWP